MGGCHCEPNKRVRLKSKRKQTCKSTRPSQDYSLSEIQIIQQFDFVHRGNLYLAQHLRSKISRLFHVHRKALLTQTQINYIKRCFKTLSQKQIPFVVRMSEFYDWDQFIGVVKERQEGISLKVFIAQLQNQSKQRRLQLTRRVIVLILQACSSLVKHGLKQVKISLNSIVIDSQDIPKFIEPYQLFIQDQDYIFQSPQSLKAGPSQKSLVWSVGVLMHLMLYGISPIFGKDKNQISKNVQNRNIKLKARIQTNIQTIFRAMFSADPQSRPSLLECLEFPFFEAAKTFSPSKELRKQLGMCFNVYQPMQRIKFYILKGILPYLSKQTLITHLEMFYFINRTRSSHISLVELIFYISRNLSQNDAQQLALSLFKDFKLPAIPFPEFRLIVLDRQSQEWQWAGKQAFKQISKQQRIQVCELMKLAMQMGLDEGSEISQLLDQFNVQEEDSIGYGQWLSFIAT